MRNAIIILLLVILASCGQRGAVNISEVINLGDDISFEDSISNLISTIELKKKDPLTGTVEINASDLTARKNSAVKVAVQKKVKIVNERYPNVDFYIFIGDGEGSGNETLANDTYVGLWKMIKRLSLLRFRVLINVKAEVFHLRNAIKNNNTSAISWNVHGNKKFFYDHYSRPVPHDIFKNAGKRLYQFVLGSCHGRQALDGFYNVPKRIKTYAWDTLVYASYIKGFLSTDSGKVFEGMPLDRSIKGEKHCS